MSEEERLDEEFVFTDKSMFGLYMAVFFKRKVAIRIQPKSFQACKVPAGGPFGRLSNKGAVAIRFEVDMIGGGK